MTSAVKAGEKTPVRVIWRTGDLDQWEYFWLIEAGEHWVTLQGRDTPDGFKHVGDTIIVPARDIRDMVVCSQ
jgi:hypothetical protein